MTCEASTIPDPGAGLMLGWPPRVCVRPILGNPRARPSPGSPEQGASPPTLPGQQAHTSAQPQPPTQPSYPPILRHISRAVATPTTHITRHVAKCKHSETMK